MATKQRWLLDRLLIPAGILPKIVSVDDLWHNEAVREQIGNAGFEYMLLVDQDAQKINAGPLGKKIYSVHAPLLSFSHSALGKNKWFIEFMTNWIYGPARFPNDRYSVAEKTMAFAKNVGAKIAVFHTYHFDQKNIPKFLSHLDILEQQYQVSPVIEHEGAYVHHQNDYPDENWRVDPIEMIRQLDKIYPTKKFRICYDTCSQISNSLPVLNIKKIIDRVAIVHLADSIPDKDLALEIHSDDDIKLVNFLYDKKYSGFIHAEINGAIGFWEELVGKIYGISALLDFPVLKSLGIKNAQRHQLNSAKFLLDNL